MLGDGIFHGQLMQVELLLQVLKLAAVGVAQADPHHMAGFCGPLPAFLEADIGDLSALVINRGGNDLAHGCS
ncbi:hypothetical protein D3C81_1868110 [compost metagenome]